MKIEQLKSEKENLESLLKDLRETHDLLHQQFKNQRSHWQEREKQWQKEKIEWLGEKDAVFSNDNNSPASEGLVKQLEVSKRTVEKLVEEKLELLDHVNSLRLQLSQLEEQGSSSGQIEKLLLEKINYSNKEREILIKKIKQLEQEAEVSSQENSHNLEIMVKEISLLKQTLAAERGHSLSKDVLSTLVKLLNDCHSQQLQEDSSPFDVMKAVEQIALDHQEKVAKMQSEIIGLREEKISLLEKVTSPDLATKAETEALKVSLAGLRQQKDADTLKLLHRIAELEAEVGSLRANNSSSNQTIQLAGTGQQQVHPKPSKIGQETTIESTALENNRGDSYPRLLKDKLKMELDLTKAHRDLKAAHQKIDSLEARLLVEKADKDGLYRTTSSPDELNLQVETLKIKLDEANAEIRQLRATKEILINEYLANSK